MKTASAWNIEQTVKLIARFIGDLRNNTIEKGASFAQRYFLHKGFKKFGREGRDALTKDVDQLYRQTFLSLSILNNLIQSRREGIRGLK